ncbi:MAG: pentapeptide repeat-containing protein [Acidobacteriia bacterium]|nr:pentapeptide repeat-containing protein [Terriglobia bacterium]
MDEIDQLRQASALLLEKARDAGVSDLAVAIQRAAEVQKLSADLERSRVEMRKLELEQQKLEVDNAAVAKREKSERTKDYVAIMTPVVTIVALTATLSFQAFQFVESEKAKRDASEAAQWADAVKTISESSKLSPGVIALNPFLKSAKYGDEARATAVQLLANTSDTIFFNDLYGAAFVPIDWRNLSQVVRLDQALNARGGPIWTKSWDAQKQVNDVSRLDETERALLDHLDDVLPKLSSQVASLLKGPRPANAAAPDLSATYFKFSDWEGVDLRGANIESARWAFVNMKGANLDRITNFEGVDFFHVAWWEVARLSAPLLAHLEQKLPCEPGAEYGRDHAKFTPGDCARALERLKQQAK